MSPKFLRLFRSHPPSVFKLHLPNGTLVQIGFVTPAYRESFEKGYPKLSAHSRRMRFLGPVSAISSKQLEFLTQPDGRNHIAYGALDASDPELPGMGVARCVRLDADSAIAEVAITVLDACQGQGVGVILHACLHLHAAQVGIRQFLYHVSTENQAFLQHLQSIGASQISRDDDVVRLMLPVITKSSALTDQTPSAQKLRTALLQVEEA